jgi:L-lactate dehydrogenase
MEVFMGTKANKISIVGTGMIGSTISYTLMLKELACEIVLVNRDKKRARAKAMDFAHCTSFLNEVNIMQGNFEDTVNSDIVVITAGILPKEDGTRMEVLESNIQIYKDIVPQISKYSPNAVIIVVTNPMDIMTYVAYKLSKFPSSKIIGSGTLLDTIRFKYLIAKNFNVKPTDIEAFVIGEHGDFMVPVFSQAKILKTSIQGYAEANSINFDFELIQKLIEKTKRAGWEIRLGNEHSCYGISLSVVTIIECMLGFLEIAVPVSTLSNGEYGIKDVYLSLPSFLDRNGVKKIEEISLNGQEYNQLHKSAEVLSEYVLEADKFLKLFE